MTTADTDAEPGKGGLGGSGGKGGTGRPTSSRFHPLGAEGKASTSDPGRYADGNTGPTGAAGDPAFDAEPGKSGRILKKSIGHSELCSALVGEAVDVKSHGNPDSALLSMVLFAVERLYLNAESEHDIEALKEVLGYLFRLTADPVLAATQPKIQAIHQRCLLLQTNLACGLDYFGKAANFVPSLSLETNETFYRRFIDAAKDLQADYDDVWAKDTEQKNWHDKFKEKIFSGKRLEDELNLKVDALYSSAVVLNDSINSLADQAIIQLSVVEDKAAEFERQFEAWKNMQQLIGLVKMAWSIVMLGVNGKSLVTNGWPLLKDVVCELSGGGADQDNKAENDKGKPKGSEADQDKKAEEDKGKKEKQKREDQVVAAFGKVPGNLESCYKDYQKYFTSKNWKSDSVKIVTQDLDKDKFDKEMESYMEIQGAKELKEAVHKYLDLVAQRNEAIVEHDSAVLQAKNIEAQIGVAEADAEEMESQIQIGVDPQRPIFVQYLRSCMQVVKSFIIDTLYMMHRSADYCTLTQSPLRLADYRVSTLEKQYTETLRRLQTAAEDVGARSDDDHWLEIKDEAQLQQLRIGQPLWFSLPLNTNHPPIGPFAGVECPMVHKVECYFEGLKTDPSYPSASATVAIMHSGVSYVYQEASGRIWSFAHAPRTISFQYRVSDRDHKESSGDLTEGGKYIMLSPFALWGVQLQGSEAEKSKLDLSAIGKVEIVFTAKGATAPIREVLTGKEVAAGV